VWIWRKKIRGELEVKIRAELETKIRGELERTIREEIFGAIRGEKEAFEKLKKYEQEQLKKEKNELELLRHEIEIRGKLAENRENNSEIGEMITNLHKKNLQLQQQIADLKQLSEENSRTMSSDELQNSELREKFKKTVGSLDLRTLVKEVVAQQFEEKEILRKSAEEKLSQENGRALSELNRINNLLSSIPGRMEKIESSLNNLTKEISGTETEWITREKTNRNNLLQIIQTKLEAFQTHLDEEKRNSTTTFV